jgi:hypothetical protein
MLFFEHRGKTPVADPERICTGQILKQHCSAPPFRLAPYCGELREAGLFLVKTLCIRVADVIRRTKRKARQLYHLIGIPQLADEIH